MSVKTSISIKEDLFAEVGRLVKEMRVSRSQVFTMAVEAFIRERQNRDLLERLNAAYADEPTAEEAALVDQMKQAQRKVVDSW